jgi:hypothetical protein
VVFRNNANVAVTITTAANLFDGSSVPNQIGLAIPAGGSVSYGFGWCSPSSGSHTVVTTFSGIDANNQAITVTGPGTVTLLAKP